MNKFNLFKYRNSNTHASQLLSVQHFCAFILHPLAAHHPHCNRNGSKSTAKMQNSEHAFQGPRKGTDLTYGCDKRYFARVHPACMLMLMYATQPAEEPLTLRERSPPSKVESSRWKISCHDYLYFSAIWRVEKSPVLKISP